jgi:hypothetical protein
MNLARSILLFLLIVASSPALTGTMRFEDAAEILGASCSKDIDTNCRGVNLDPGRLKDCLARNQDSVSAQCKADYVRAFDAIQKRVIARAAVPKICERDAFKLCGGAQKGEANLECIYGDAGAPNAPGFGDAGIAVRLVRKNPVSHCLMTVVLIVFHVLAPSRSLVSRRKTGSMSCRPETAPDIDVAALASQGFES